MAKKYEGRLLFGDFQKIVLDFQLKEHEKYLTQFTQLYQQVDCNRFGFLSQQQLWQLVASMQMGQSEEDIEALVRQADPNDHSKIPYSDIVQLLSSKLVALDPHDPDSDLIPLLEKYCHVNF